MAAAQEGLFPCASKEELAKAFVGKRLGDVPTPAAVLDRAVVERNCCQMLEACRVLDVDFRPHVKTHKTNSADTKTIEVTLLQLGDASNGIKLVVSTVADAEHLSDHLYDAHKSGQPVNVLYGVPLPPSQIQRLIELRNKIGPYGVSVLVDHPSQLEVAPVFKRATGGPLQLFVKVDTGYHRAGLNFTTKAFGNLMHRIYSLEETGTVTLVGFYSHAGHSYGGSCESDAISLLTEEIEGLKKAVAQARVYRQRYEHSQTRSVNHSQPRYVLSVGATPTATSLQNIWSFSAQSSSTNTEQLLLRAEALIKSLKASGLTLELHAGVYPFLDMQQLATKASPSAAVKSSTNQESTITTADVALTIMTEVASLYGDRESPEALIAAGSLALGREPCKSYNGWGIVSAWGMPSTSNAEGRSGWQVGRISQEHGILTKDMKAIGEPMELKIGQKVRIWPNHACVAGAGFGWYLVVDSSLPEDRHDEIVDVFIRWRGW